jgi:hypothetical protein
MSLCQYKDIFGKPGEGAHSIRLFNIAVIDVLATIILALVIHQILLERILCVSYISFWWVMGGCFISGIIAHRMFCVRTTVDKLLFKD